MTKSDEETAAKEVAHIATETFLLSTVMLQKATGRRGPLSQTGTAMLAAGIQVMFELAPDHAYPLLRGLVDYAEELRKAKVEGREPPERPENSEALSAAFTAEANARAKAVLERGGATLN